MITITYILMIAVVSTRNIANSVRAVLLVRYAEKGVMEVIVKAEDMESKDNIDLWIEDEKSILN